MKNSVMEIQVIVRQTVKEKMKRSSQGILRGALKITLS